MSNEEKPKGTPPAPEDSGPDKVGDKPAASKAAAKKPAARKPVKKGPAYEDLAEDPLLKSLRRAFADGILSGQSFLGQPIYSLHIGCLYDAMVLLRDTPEWDFDYLVDLTALDYLGDEQRFEIVYHLYSHARRRLIRVKVRVSEGEMVPSVTSIWKTADWMEREVYDMFGIEFSGHPDLKRILLPEDWHGHPLRKDYDIKLQDQAWIREHLRIRKTPV